MPSSDRRRRRPARPAAPMIASPLALLMALVVTARPAEGQNRWQAILSSERQVLDAEEWSDWESWGIEVRRTWDRGTFALSAVRSERFDLVDHIAALDGYVNVTRHTYLNGRLQFSHDPQVVPAQDYRLEVFHAFRPGWEGSVGHRLMDVSPEDVHVFNVSVARYLPGWYLRLRGDFTPSLDETGLFVGTVIRRSLPSLDGNVEAGAGAGEEVVDVAAGPTVDVRASRFVSLRTQLFPWDRTGISGGLAYYAINDLPARVAMRVAAIVRW